MDKLGKIRQHHWEERLNSFCCGQVCVPHHTNVCKILRLWGAISRLQNSPYFCVFKYVRAVKQKVWNEAENRDRDAKNTYGRVRLVLFARVRLLRHALPSSLLILRKKTRLFCSLSYILVSFQQLIFKLGNFNVTNLKAFFSMVLTDFP